MQLERNRRQEGFATEDTKEVRDAFDALGIRWGVGIPLNRSTKLGIRTSIGPAEAQVTDPCVGDGYDITITVRGLTKGQVLGIAADGVTFDGVMA